MVLTSALAVESAALTSDDVTVWPLSSGFRVTRTTNDRSWSGYWLFSS